MSGWPPDRDWTRVPVEPLYRAAGAENWCHLARILDVPHRSVLRWRVAGGLVLRRADAMAAAIALHPVDVWPEWFELEPTMSVTPGREDCRIALAAAGG